MKTIAIFERRTYIKNRIKKVFSDENVKFIEPQTLPALQVLLSSEDTPLDLVIMEEVAENAEEFEALKLARRLRPGLPVVLFTSTTSRSSFVKAIKLGATDYILHDIDDRELNRRIKRHLLNAFQDEEMRIGKVVLPFDQYLKGELKKAEKGGYPLSLGLVMIHPDDEVKIVDDDHYHTLIQELFVSLKELYWETDVIIRYSNHAFISVYPFCDAERTGVIYDKMKEYFEAIQLKRDAYDHFKMTNMFVSYPDHGNRPGELLEALDDKMRRNEA